MKDARADRELTQQGFETIDHCLDAKTS
jgi:hypothetical protein